MYTLYMQALLSIEKKVLNGFKKWRIGSIASFLETNAFIFQMKRNSIEFDRGRMWNMSKLLWGNSVKFIGITLVASVKS